MTLEEIIIEVERHIRNIEEGYDCQKKRDELEKYRKAIEALKKCKGKPRNPR